MTAPAGPTTLPVPEDYVSAHVAALAGFVRPGSHLDGGYATCGCRGVEGGAPVRLLRRAG